MGIKTHTPPPSYSRDEGVIRSYQISTDKLFLGSSALVEVKTKRELSKLYIPETMFLPLQYQFFFQFRCNKILKAESVVTVKGDIFEEFSTQPLNDGIESEKLQRLSRSSDSVFEGTLVVKIKKGMSTYKTKKKYFLKFSIQVDETTAMSITSPVFKTASRRPKTSKKSKEKKDSSKRKRDEKSSSSKRRKKELKVETSPVTYRVEPISSSTPLNGIDLFKKKFSELMELKESFGMKEQEKCMEIMSVELKGNTISPILPEDEFINSFSQDFIFSQDFTLF